MTSAQPNVTLDQLVEKYGGRIENVYVKDASVAGQPSDLYIVDSGICVSKSLGKYTPQEIGLAVNIAFGSDPLPTYAKRAALGLSRPANDNQPAAPKLLVPPKPTLIDAQTLLGMTFSPVKQIVPGYIAEGLTILGGRPKLGKSWLALGACVAVSSGGSYLGVDCEQGDVLYLALEDNQRRLQDRLRVVLPVKIEGTKLKHSNLSRLMLMTESPRVNAGLIETLDTWRTETQNPRLVIVDTFALVRPPRGRNQDPYEADYAAVSPLQRWASEHRLAVVIVTHVRKMDAEDPLEMISGTNGLTGAADAILVLTRDGSGPKLYGRGRDVEQIEKALRFDSGLWTALGDADDVNRSAQRKAILEALKEASLPMKPGEIAKSIDAKVDGVRHLLPRMVEDGSVQKLAYGTYQAAPPT